MPPTSPPASDSTAPTLWGRSAWTWIISSAAILIIGLMIGAYFFFTAPIPDGPPDTTSLEPATATRQNAAAELELARLRAEARRNTLALGAGLAALAALALAVRRQHHHEQSTRKAQEDEQRRQDHLEEDALQRRITDSRVRAVDQLGSDNATVRIGGLHNLERIGQLHPELRQVVFDEVCAYLRHAHTPPATVTRGTISKRQFEPLDPPSMKTRIDDETDVRRTAQEILERHLHPGRKGEFWDHTRLNLRGAHLDDLDLMGCRLGEVDFSDAIFSGDTVFSSVQFRGDARFSGATFAGEAWFDRSRFDGGGIFRYVTFTSAARFSCALFTRDADFTNAIFKSDAHFSGTTLRSGYFIRSTFIGAAYFGATTSSTEHLKDAAFIEEAVFTDTKFHGLLHPGTEMSTLLRRQNINFTSFAPEWISDAKDCS